MQLAALMNRYLELARSDHHKDRDCHFSIEKRWSYGEFKGYRVVHYGYVNCENEGCSAYFPTEQAAQKHLEALLTKWIASEEKWRKENPDD